MGVRARRKSTQSRARESRTLQDAIIVRMEAYIEFEEATTSKSGMMLNYQDVADE